MEKDMTRRKLLLRAGCAIAAAAFPSIKGVAAQQANPEVAGQPVSPVMNKLSAYMAEARGRGLPGDVVEKAKQHILDTFAAMISGSELPPGRSAIQFVRSYGGNEVATVVASNTVFGLIQASLPHGVLEHAAATVASHGTS